jgi:hypothetical protein
MADKTDAVLEMPDADWREMSDGAYATASRDS